MPPITSSNRSSGTVRVAMGFRPGGFSSSRDTSRSPNAVIASVRGIGVAVITRQCGFRPLRSIAPR